jgi:hypothetical protein
LRRRRRPLDGCFHDPRAGTTSRAARAYRRFFDGRPGEPPYRAGLLSQDHTKAGRLRRVLAGGRAWPTDNSAKSAEDRRSFGATVPRQPSDTLTQPSPARARAGPASNRSLAASPAPNPHHPSGSSRPGTRRRWRGRLPRRCSRGWRRNPPPPAGGEPRPANRITRPTHAARARLVRSSAPSASRSVRIRSSGLTTDRSPNFSASAIRRSGWAT